MKSESFNIRAYLAQLPLFADLADSERDQAQATFARAVSAEPTSLQVHMKLAGLQLSRQDFKASIPTYQAAIGLDANHDKAWLGIAFAYLHTGQDALAAAAFDAAIRINPANRDQLAPVLDKLQAR
ncbi:MAG: tetratricopeptide repeat protein [Rhodoferax sp.]|nr:tetratricopeptide repeat protein [Rhodoferax sp.]